MKRLHFYPNQVGRALGGRDVGRFDAGEQRAVQFFVRRGRRLGISCAVLNDVKGEDLLNAGSPEAVERLQRNLASRFYFNLSPAGAAVR